ncbi:MAG: hypothetical protein K9W44_17630 [Candidatus Lokiarchaeota archaeon]|nr:hypothetical protein [Candidatus Harpocratesius repetitus]
MITEDLRPTEITNIQHLVDRNGEIVRDHLITKMKESLEIGSRLIDEELNGMAAIFRPIIKSFYSNLVQKDLEHGTIKSINGMIRMSKKLVMEGIDPNTPEFERRLTQKFPSYLKNDQTGRQCKPYHPNFPQLKAILKNTFRAQICGILPLLKVQIHDISSYNELCRAAFKTEKHCKDILRLQTDSMKEGLNVIKRDLSILNIMTGKELIFRVLQKGFEKKIKDFNKEIEEIFNCEN